MLGPAIQRLLSVSSPSLFNGDAAIEPGKLKAAGVFANDIASILEAKNGFFAFEGALRFFPYTSVPVSYGILEWNEAALWRYEFEDLAEGCFFFAEDIFGVQFCTSGNAIASFDPETGQRTFVAESLEAWGKAVLDDYEVLTGHRLAHEWQERNGKLPGRKRLVPKILFVLGGQFDISNLAAMDVIEGMRARGCVARQIRYLPEGAKVRFDITE
jgi:hypothetical protein